MLRLIWVVAFSEFFSLTGLYSIVFVHNTKRILGECFFFISSLPDKASRTLIESQGLPSDSACVLKAEPGKLDNK